MTKVDEFRKASDRLRTMSGMGCIHDEYKRALNMGAKALDTMSELEKLNELSAEAKP